MHRMGIDCGSTTIKIVLSKEDKIIFKKYERHNADILNALKNILKDMKKEHSEIKKMSVVFTGSAGFKIANELDMEHTQEVIAATNAIQKNYDDIDVCIELGGEDAKLIFFDGLNPEQKMNGVCAGGTGAFIDQMASLLNTDVQGVNELAKNYDKLYPIAARCGVFAKTDVQPLLNQGVEKTNIAASIYQAVVNQTIAGLAQGKQIKGKVIFLGGPLTFASELRKRFVETLNLKDGDVFLPENSEVFMAYGAGLSSEKGEVNIDDLIEKIEKYQKNKTFTYKKTLPKLFNSKSEKELFDKRHNSNSVKFKDISSYSGKAYLGIDCGSTTTKVTLITENKDIIYQYYSSNNGQPVDVVKSVLKELYDQLHDGIIIAGAASSGYGEKLIQAAFNLDKGQVETICHYKAAKHFMPNVDFIIDIGGQDMKCFKIKNNNISSIILNEACSSGCGSFIETFSSSLGYEIEEFAKIGVEANQPVDLGSKCTVFMNSSVKSAQKEGATPGDISAGLAYSVVKNALYKVIRVHDVRSECGENIIVQGGTFYNDAILRAFELETGSNVVRPNIAGLMGAYGAALIAKELNLDKSTIISSDELSDFNYKSKPITCGACPNKCLMTLNIFNSGEKYVSGNRCEIGAGKIKETKMPNMYEYKYNKLWTYENLLKKPKGNIGIPFVLNNYENIPFWAHFFKECGYNIKLSGRSNKELYEEGQTSIPSDTVCYPAKLVHGHISRLMNMEDIDYIFYPNMPFNFREKISSQNHFNCPVVSNYPELINVNVDDLDNYLMPYIALNKVSKKGKISLKNSVFVKKMTKYLKPYLKITESEVKKGYENGLKEYAKFKDDIKLKGEEYINWAKENSKKIIVLAGRPYHIDPEINHGIDKLLTSLDCVVLSEDAVAHLETHMDVNILNQWSYHTRLYDAAKWTTKQPSANLIQLVSFGCGLDAITTDEVKDILELKNKFYTQLKIDEISNLGAVNIRIRSLLENL